MRGLFAALMHRWRNRAGNLSSRAMTHATLVDRFEAAPIVMSGEHNPHAPTPICGLCRHWFRLTESSGLSRYGYCAKLSPAPAPGPDPAIIISRSRENLLLNAAIATVESFRCDLGERRGGDRS